MERRTLLVTAVLGISLALSTAAARGDTGDVGYRDGSTGGGSVTGTKRAESALWINNGFWWANMWDPVSNDFHIFRLNTGTQSWSDTGVRIDDRSSTSADTLWDGGHLYVASHRQSETPASGYPSYLFRFSFNPVSNGYALDSGFPVQINNFKTETLTIAKDSTGKLWATWMQGSKIYVNRTLGDDKSWGTPFALPVSGTGVSSDDISAVVAFGGNKVGVMWGNQNSSQDGFYFAIHDDGQADTTWQPSVLAWGGSGVADDHINLKADSSGRLYAAVKTSFTSSSQPLTALLVRDPSTGSWKHYAVDTVADCPNRPTVDVDENAGVVHVFQTGAAAPSFTCSSSGGDIYEKDAPLSTFAFPSGRGTVVLRDADRHEMHNVTSTKQSVSNSTGLVALAVERTTSFYWHHYDPLGPAGPPTAGFTGSPTSGTAPLSVAFTDQSTGGPTSWSWSFGDGATSSSQNPSHTYTAPGTYDVTLAVANGAGADTETKTGYVTVSPAPPGPLTFTPVGDARVSQASPTTNYATHTTLRLQESTTGGTLHSYVQFNVAGLSGPVLSAKLRLYVTDGSVDGGGIYRVSDNWQETTLTWNNAPPISGTPIASVGKISTGTWVEFNLGATITGNGTYSFGLKNNSTDAAWYSTKEGSHPPELVVTQG